jgi:hypothetical protein
MAEHRDPQRGPACSRASWLAICCFLALPELRSPWSIGNITFMALARKKATTIALEPEMNELLTFAADDCGVSRSEFVRRQLALVLEQYRRHPRPRTAGIIRRRLPERGDEAELYADRRR